MATAMLMMRGNLKCILINKCCFHYDISGSSIAFGIDEPLRRSFGRGALLVFRRGVLTYVKVHQLCISHPFSWWHQDVDAKSPSGVVCMARSPVERLHKPLQSYTQKVKGSDRSVVARGPVLRTNTAHPQKESPRLNDYLEAWKTI